MEKRNISNQRPWRHLYNTPAYDQLRRACFARDRLRCRICKGLCAGAYGQPNSPICDHITPHKGNTALFYSLTNCQTLCKHCHDRHKARIEARGFDTTSTHQDGWPSDPDHPANRRT